MSMLPFLLDDALAARPHLPYPHYYDSVHPEDLVAPLRSSYLRPWRHAHPHHNGVANISSDKEGFKVNLDVKHFKPEELTVKVVDDNLIVEGKHEEKSDEHGFVSRQFTRRYKVPENVNLEALQSKLSSDGILMLHAPNKSSNDKEKIIPIIHTNAPAIKSTKATVDAIDH